MINIYFYFLKNSLIVSRKKLLYHLKSNFFMKFGRKMEECNKKNKKRSRMVARPKKSIIFKNLFTNGHLLRQTFSIVFHRIVIDAVG